MSGRTVVSSAINLLPITQKTLTSASKTIIAALGAGVGGALVDLRLQNTDTVTRTVTISDGTTTFEVVDIAAGDIYSITWWPADMAWVTAANAAMTVAPSADSVIKVCGGRYYERAV